MNHKWKYSISALLTGMLLTITACSALSGPGVSSSQIPAPSSVPATVLPVQEVLSDPFEYCAAVGQIDLPDERYSGPMLSDDLFNEYIKAAGLDPNLNYPATFKQMTTWRCMDGRVYACNSGANIPCSSKANTDKAPTQAMLDYCAQFPDSSVIPMSITGHSTIYGWYCVQDTPGDPEPDRHGRRSRVSVPQLADRPCALIHPTGRCRFFFNIDFKPGRPDDNKGDRNEKNR